MMGPSAVHEFKANLYRLGFIILVIIGVAIAVLPRVEQFFILQSAERGEATLRLSVEGLQSTLQRYQTLPALIAERPNLKALLNDPANEDLQAIANEELRQTAVASQASDVYLMDRSGLTLAASSYQTELSFVGNRFAYRPYFTEALAGGLGRFFALGTTSGKRGYFFASPVRDNGINGVVAVKFEVDRFEAAWRGGDSEVIVSDQNSVVFMSSKPDWHFRALSPLTPEAIQQIEENRRYPISRITQLNADTEPYVLSFSLMQIDDGGVMHEYVSSTMEIADAGWRVIVLNSTGPAYAQALAVLSIAILLTLFGGLVTAIYLQRRARLAERFEAQRANQELLEGRVAARTADLIAANDKLVTEVEERRAAEQKLRVTQSELVQAGKLAALGQMSAALSHEFNQPLAAVKSYADNATMLMDHQRPEEVKDNISRISQMVDRMATISKHLRNFARRPQEKTGPIALVSVLEEAIELMAAEFRSCGAELKFEKPEQEIWVNGGRVRLQQVVINLLKNALDAMAKQKQPLVRLSIVEARDKVEIKVRDYGEGLAEDMLQTIFDPFVTTKLSDKGMGLGLSISFNIVKDFGGSLSAYNDAEGGAVFVVSLLPEQAPTGASNLLETAAE